MARTELFRGLRSVPVAFSGVLAWASAIAQAWWIPDPLREVPAYLALWIGAAGVGLTAAALEMALRARHDARWAREHTRLAIEQFLPCVVAGGLTTVVLARTSDSLVVLLPGLWSVFFSLGIFATRRLLPGAILGVACFYLVAGLVVLGQAATGPGLSPWAMGIPFGCGQLLAAFILYRTLEREHAHQ